MGGVVCFTNAICFIHAISTTPWLHELAVEGAVRLTRKSEDLSTTSAKSLHRDPLLEDSRWGGCWLVGFHVCCFPLVVFPPCGVWLGLCVGRVDPDDDLASTVYSVP